ARLHVERLVDRLVTDPHLLVVGVLASQSGRYLLGRPALLEPPLDRGQKPRAATELALLGAREARAGAPFGAQRAVARAPARVLDLARDRGGRAVKLTRDRSRGLTGRDPAADALALLEAKPQLGVVDPPAHELRLVADPPDRHVGAAELRDDLLHPRSGSQPLLDCQSLRW